MRLRPRQCARCAHSPSAWFSLPPCIVSCFMPVLHSYDLLCLEGLVRALQVFMDKREPPHYQVTQVDKMEQLTVYRSVRSPSLSLQCSCVRVCVCAWNKRNAHAAMFLMTTDTLCSTHLLPFFPFFGNRPLVCAATVSLPSFVASTSLKKSTSASLTSRYAECG